jgi:Gpi18-like mannosyltransferase
VYALFGDVLAPAAILIGAIGAHGWLALETNLQTALALATLWSVEREKDLLAGILLGLAFLCRYDAALLVPIVVAERWLLRRALPVHTLLVSLAVVFPWRAAA